METPPATELVEKNSTPSVTPEPENLKNKSAAKTLKLTNLLKTNAGKTDKPVAIAEKVLNEPFSEQQLREVWMEYAEQRKKFQAEFQMLSQPFEFRDNKHIVVNLLSSVHEAMLNNIRIELTTFIREKLKNSSIVVSGELTTSDDKKMIYTNRDKFEYLADKNPILKELKERLGLDTDF